MNTDKRFSTNLQEQKQKGDDKMSCPKCGNELELDPDGGWCPKCKDYWDKHELKEKWKEDE